MVWNDQLENHDMYMLTYLLVQGFSYLDTMIGQTVVRGSLFVLDIVVPNLLDVLWLEKLAPHSSTEQYRHNETGEDNADAHLKRQIMGREVVVAVTNGKLDFGSWEQIFYGEFDGQRNKSTCEGNRQVNNKNPGYILSPCKVKMIGSIPAIVESMVRYKKTFEMKLYGCCCCCQQ